MYTQSTNSNNNTVIVADKYRTNPLSHQPDGWTVKVHYPSGAYRICDKVKDVDAYTKHMKNKSNVIRVEQLNYVN